MAVAHDDEVEVGATADLTPGTLVGCGRYVVGNADGTLFALGRHCRHLRADLAGGSIDADGRLVCPWHRSAYDVTTGRQLWRFYTVPGDPKKGFENAAMAMAAKT